ncbi:PAS domain-containing protein [Algoriphagus mannitolivorans]|uniref:PAS domain-containing protein n=1 Tax=Algoriphagus mannitolivorans TaxID=226504 RepID=UPI000407467F|nr:PAS domain-containing protein [Algoriphagus mannitolivorans]
MNWLRSLFFKRPAITGLITFLFSIGIGVFISIKEYQLEQVQEKEEVELAVENIEDKINDIVSTANSAVNILAYLVQTDRIEENYLEVGQSIIDNIDIIDQIQFLDQGKIVATYPLQGNEMVIGYDILEDANRRSEALMAIERGKLYFAGPLDLRQGGKGIIGRLPLFKEEKFIGFTAVIIDWGKFQEEVFGGFEISPKFKVDFFKLDENLKNPFSLLSADFSTAKGPLQTVFIRDGNWEVKVQLIESKAFIKILPSLIFRIITSLILGFLIYRFAQQPHYLEEQIDRTTKELQLSNQRFELATKATSEVIWDWDLVNNRTFRSDNFEKMFGFARQDSINNDSFWRSRIHPEDIARVEKNLQIALEGNIDSWSQEFRIKRNDEEYIYVIDKGIILRDAKGKAIRMIGSTQDITKRKIAENNLENQKQRLSNVIEGTQAGTWEWNVQSGETIFNETWARLLGYTLKELEPVSIQTMLNLSHPDDLEEADRVLNQYYLGQREVYEAEIRMRHKNGNWVWILSRGKVFSWNEEGQPLMMSGTHVDITYKKLREEEIKSTNRKLEAANEELKSFASVASHDMKEPLRMISSFLQLLEKRYSTQLDEKGKQYIHFAVDGSKRLSQLVEDMMEYAKIGYDESQLTRVDLNEVIEGVLSLKRDLINEKKAVVVVHDLPSVLGIHIPIRSVLINLISNALKYSQEGRTPTLTIYSKNLGAKSQITIQDNGIGIEKEYFNKIFNLFGRLHGKTEYSGTGIGLAICKKVITQHGGEIWLESQVGRGSKFHFTLTNFTHGPDQYISN